MLSTFRTQQRGCIHKGQVYNVQREHHEAQANRRPRRVVVSTRLLSPSQAVMRWAALHSATVRIIRILFLTVKYV